MQKKKGGGGRDILNLTRKKKFSLAKRNRDAYFQAKPMAELEGFEPKVSAILYLADVTATTAFHGKIYKQNSLLPGVLLIKRAAVMGKLLLLL